MNRKTQTEGVYWIYTRSLNEWTQVPKEVHDEHFQFFDSFRHRMQRRGLCSCPRQDWWYCDADCTTCRYCDRTGELSFDEVVQDDDGDPITLADKVSDGQRLIQDVVTDRMIIELVISYAKKTDPLIEQAIRLWQEDDTRSQREIARLLAISQTTFIERLDRFTCRFQKKFQIL